MLGISGILLTSVHWSFKQGFNQYLLQAEANQLDKLITLLQSAYQKNGNWQFLQNNRHTWIEFLRQGLDEQQIPPRFLQAQGSESFPDRPPHPPHNGGYADFNRPPPPLESDRFGNHPPPHVHHHPKHNEPHVLAKFLGSRLQLLDLDKNVIVGFKPEHKNEFLRPILSDHKPVGWLSLQSSDLITDHLAQLFVTQQIRHTFLIGLATLCFAALAAFILARRLLVPIKRISLGANNLVNGDYETQVKVSSQDELGQLADNFNLLARTLLSNEQNRRRWIADISHELRTPLAVLRGEIEAVLDGIRDFSPENVKSLYTEVISLNRLVDDLYELSLSDLGNSHYHQEHVDLTGILQEVISNQQPRFQANHLQLFGDFNYEQSVEIKGDARRLHQLFSNLCENSRRYTSPGGYLEISLQSSINFVTVVFQDTKPGVPETALDKLFDRLYRVDPSRNRELGGAGLGLAICQAIVKAHQGSITAFHAIHGGLGIRIEFPRIFHP